MLRSIIDLVEARLLFAEYSPGNGFSHWAFHKSTLAECLARVATHVKDSVIQEKSEEESLINLTDASRQLFVVGLNAASILLCVAEGKLKAYQPTGQELRLGVLLFDRSDIQRYIQSMKTENCWIGREETTKILGVKDVTLTRWVRSGLISPTATYGHVQYFNQRAIVAFVAEHVTSEEAATILGVGRLTVQKWARLGRLPEACVSGPNIDEHHAYLFNKEKLIHWRHERLTFGETSLILRVSHSTLHKWVEQGKIFSLEDMGGKQRWFSRKAVLELYKN
jgi:predicted site-specific integrase-resolvase